MNQERGSYGKQRPQARTATNKNPILKLGLKSQEKLVLIGRARTGCCERDHGRVSGQGLIG